MLDFLLDDSSELKIEAGDFVTGTSDRQHQALLLECSKGDFKQLPNVGVGIINFLEAENPGGLFEEVKRQFISDGMDVKTIQLTDGKLSIDAEY